MGTTGTAASVRQASQVQTVALVSIIPSSTVLLWAFQFLKLNV